MIIKESHPFLSDSQQMIEFAKPLQQLGITYFTYTKSEADGSRTYLTTHPNVLEHYLQGEYYLIGNVESAPKRYANQILFWDTLPKQHIYDEMVRARDIDHGIFMINQEDDYCEFFGFGAKKGNSQVINNYINNIELLKKFTKSFKDKAKTIIKRADASKIKLPFHNDPLDFVNGARDIIVDRNQRISLSSRQIDCASLLLKGMQYKEIASILNISARTVETHINYLRTKLDCSNKTELIIRLSDMGIINN